VIKQYRTGVKIMPNILIVEDDININNLLCEVLRKAGYMCEQAFTPKDFYKLHRKILKVMTKIRPQLLRNY
jgi:DNA-binding response OmpR family regulator